MLPDPSNEFSDDVHMRVIRVLEYTGPARQLIDHLGTRVPDTEFGDMRVRELATHREYVVTPTEETK